MMEVFAGFLTHTDHHLGRLLDYLESSASWTTPSIMVISDNGASAEGGPAGTTNEAQFFNNAPESFEDSLARDRRDRWAHDFNHYPWGWTWAGNTPFRRWKRETYRGGAATRSWSAGRGGSAPRAKSAPSTPTPSTWSRPCWICSASSRRRPSAGHPGPVPGPEFRVVPGGRGRASAPPPQYYEMFGHRALYHDGGGRLSRPGPSFAEAEGFGDPISADRLSALDGPDGSSTTRRGLRGVHNVADDNRIGSSH